MLPKSNCDQWTLGTTVILYGNDELFIFMQFVIILKYGAIAEACTTHLGSLESLEFLGVDEKKSRDGLFAKSPSLRFTIFIVS